MRITLVISSLARGGAERVMSVLASSWAERGKDITLLTFDHGGTPAYPIHPSVKLCSLGLEAPSGHFLQALYKNLRRIRVLRRAIRDSHPDMVISFMDTVNVLTLFATRRLGTPVIVCEHIDPALYNIGRIWGNLRRLAYPFAYELICLTQASLGRFESMTNVRGRIIPDPVVAPPSCSDSNTRGDGDRAGRVLVAMGRLVPQKGFDILLNVFSGIAERHPDWSLKILGSGPLGAELETQSKVLGLANRVHFTGEVSDPFPVLRAADLFVLSSRFEGFGLALCEAMACGLPVVSFDCPSGPGDIIRHGVDGILVPPEDAVALSAALDRLMGDAEERKRLASRAPEVLSRFGTDRILTLWENLFEDLLPTSAGRVRTSQSMHQAVDQKGIQEQALAISEVLPELNSEAKRKERQD
jgi:glycosyltransferase involved in cell wall biosynthesis